MELLLLTGIFLLICPCPKKRVSLSFDFQNFCFSLAKNTDLISCTYYVGEVKTIGTKKSQKMYENQQRLISHLKKNKLRYTFGYLLKDGNGIFHEKDVDVHMAVDILVATYENLCNRIILVS